MQYINHTYHLYVCFYGMNAYVVAAESGHNASAPVGFSALVPCSSAFVTVPSQSKCRLSMYNSAFLPQCFVSKSFTQRDSPVGD